MRPKLVVLVSLIALCGCTVANQQITDKNGTVTKSGVSSFFGKVAGFKHTITGPDGTISSTSLDNYSADTEAIVATGNAIGNVLSKVRAMENTNSVPTNAPASKP